MRRKCATVAAVVMLLFAAAPSSAVAACGPAQQRPERPNQPYPDPRLPKGLTPADFEAYRAVVETFRTGSETAQPPPPGWTSQSYKRIVDYLTAKRPYWGQPGTPLEPWNPPLVAAAVAYHTWTAVHAQSNIVTGHRIHALHIDVARQLLDLVNDEELPPRFRRLWMMTVAAFMMDRLVLGDTLTHIDEAVNRYPDDIDLHLAAGAFAELMASPHITLPDVSGTNRHVIALLQQRKLQGLDLARSHYRIVLGIAPSNSEAHLRLGRVLLKRPTATMASNTSERRRGPTTGASATLRMSSSPARSRAVGIRLPRSTHIGPPTDECKGARRRRSGSAAFCERPVASTKRWQPRAACLPSHHLRATTRRGTISSGQLAGPSFCSTHWRVSSDDALPAGRGARVRGRSGRPLAAADLQDERRPRFGRRARHRPRQAGHRALGLQLRGPRQRRASAARIGDPGTRTARHRSGARHQPERGRREVAPPEGGGPGCSRCAAARRIAWRWSPSTSGSSLGAR